MVPTEHVVLDELAVDSVAFEIDDDARSALERTGLVTSRWAGPGMWKLLPNGKVGAAQIGKLLVEVKPKDKVGISQILFLLSYAKDPGFRPENVEAEQSTDLWAALGETLARLGERATERGVLQGYISRDETIRTVRGRIRISDQVARRPGIMFPVEVTHDEYTVDIPENRILRSAVRRMLSIQHLNQDVRRRLLHLDRRLLDATLLVRGLRLPFWTPSRLNSAYTPALRIAEVILQNTVAEARPGHLHVASFIVDMAKVFEDFATTALTEALRKYPGRTLAQYKTHLDEKRSDGRKRLVMRPDVVHEIGAIPTLIFDAKYKAASSSGQYPNADHYQMLAYATALIRNDAWLIYAGKGPTVARRVHGTSITTRELSLDLSAAPSIILKRIEATVAIAYGRAMEIPESTLIDTHDLTPRFK
ncbi:McrC family protein [Arthrobacter sp. NPDC055138]